MQIFLFQLLYHKQLRHSSLYITIIIVKISDLLVHLYTNKLTNHKKNTCISFSFCIIFLILLIDSLIWMIWFHMFFITYSILIYSLWITRTLEAIINRVSYIEFWTKFSNLLGFYVFSRSRFTRLNFYLNILNVHSSQESIN